VARCVILLRVNFVHVNFHREPYKNETVIEECLGFLARESPCIICSLAETGYIPHVAHETILIFL
jgi:hypothetical protein